MFEKIENCDPKTFEILDYYSDIFNKIENWEYTINVMDSLNGFKKKFWQYWKDDKNIFFKWEIKDNIEYININWRKIVNIDNHLQFLLDSNWVYREEDFVSE
jgi:hypothetical protein